MSNMDTSTRTVPVSSGPLMLRLGRMSDVRENGETRASALNLSPHRTHQKLAQAPWEASRRKRRPGAMAAAPARVPAWARTLQV
jgi:hypothetical protein